MTADAFQVFMIGAVFGAACAGVFSAAGAVFELLALVFRRSER